MKWREFYSLDGWWGAIVVSIAVPTVIVFYPFLELDRLWHERKRERDEQ